MIGAILRSYRLRYDARRWTPIAVEAPFRTEWRDTVLTGTVDLVVETPDGIWVVDHKTTSDLGPYQDQVVMPIQAGIYLLAHPEAVAFCYSVIVKPRARPSTGETALAYSHRVEGNIQIVDFIIRRDPSTMVLFEESLYRDISQIRHCTANDLCTRNPANCRAYYSLCEYAHHCRGDHAIEATPHEESYSQSRIGTWKLCQWKHWLRYTAGIQVQTSSPAATFGTAVHAELAAYWSNRMDMNGGSSSNEYEF